jgi:hypothetical protein
MKGGRIVLSPFLQGEREREMKIAKNATFKDSEGLEWEIKITAGSLLKACRKTGITLSSLTDMNIEIEVILASLPFFCEKQITARKMSHEEFLERLTLDEMQAIVTELFPSMASAFDTGDDSSLKGEDVVDAPKSLGPVKTS